MISIASYIITTNTSSPTTAARTSTPTSTRSPTTTGPTSSPTITRSPTNSPTVTPGANDHVVLLLWDSNQGDSDYVGRVGAIVHYAMHLLSGHFKDTVCQARRLYIYLSCDLAQMPPMNHQSRDSYRTPDHIRLDQHYIIIMKL